MADREFEEFKNYFDQMPQHIRAKPQCYTLVCDITPCEERLPDLESHLPSWLSENMTNSSSSDDSSDSLPLIGLRLSTPVASGEELSLPNTPPPNKEGRKRRKLPEIPNFIPEGVLLQSVKCEVSLADELEKVVCEKQSPSRPSRPSTSSDRKRSRKHLTLTPLLHRHNNGEETGSADSDIFGGTDGDSGHFSVHSPEPIASSPVRRIEESSSPSSPGSLRSSIGGEPYPEADILEATHRGLHRFVPRHHDEIEVDIGDPIYVQTEADDLWCEGVNLRTRRKGIFPSAYVVDAEYSEFDPNTPVVRKERYLLHYLGSVETMQHKGQQVLCSAVRRIREMHPSPFPQACILEISDQGLRMVDKNKPPPNQVSCLDYFYALRNVSFCGFHPTDHRYFGFITKHPTRQRFACHVFRGSSATRPIAEAVGRAFQRFYQKYIETAYPVEEFFMEDEMTAT